MALSLTPLAGMLVLAVSSVLPVGTQTAPVENAPVALPQLAVFAPGRAPDLPVPEVPPPVDTPPAEAFVSSACTVGMIVMVPDGREGRVAASDGETCSVLAYGEAYLSLWNQDMIEPVYPQHITRRIFGH